MVVVVQVESADVVTQSSLRSAFAGFFRIAACSQLPGPFTEPGSPTPFIPGLADHLMMMEYILSRYLLKYYYAHFSDIS